MNQQPDKIFRDKLQHYQPPVSAAAWSRVSGNLRQRSDKMLWLKVAAGLLLLAVASVLLVTIDIGSRRLTVSEKTDSPGEQPATRETIRSEPQKLPQDRTAAEEKASTTSTVTDPSPGKKSESKAHAKPSVPSTTSLDRGEQNRITTGAPLDNILKQEQDAPAVITESPAVATAEKKNFTIVFTATEVEKYRMKKNAEAEATSEDEEASTWQKLLDKAYDLKHNQDPLGNLRQKKNEILALNFKNDKQSHENK